VPGPAEVDSSRPIERIDLVTGKAQDSHDKRYIWTYEKHRVFDMPPGEDPAKVSIIMLDGFRLIGNGFKRGGSFSWRWEFQVPPESAFDPGPERTGVVFPTTSSILTNVLNLKNFGDRTCDPL
jgi:hypothetical protein